MRPLLTLCVLLIGAAGCGDDTTLATGVDMSIANDLAPLPDLSPNFSGVGCGNMTCGNGQQCCLIVDNTNSTVSAACIAANGSCQGGAILTCDGPEDCMSSQFCCGMITFSGGVNPDAGAIMFGSGNASCTATCDFSSNYPASPTNVTSRLCHFDADCTGLSAGPLPINKCCSTPAAPGLKFCATPIASTITCP